MPTLEQLLRQATKAARKPTVRPQAAPLWLPPDDPALLPDMIQTMDFGGARTCEERCQAVHDARSRMLWDYLALPGQKPGPMPWAACLPPIWDPAGVLDGEHRDGWASTHSLMDYYPAPAGGLQHRVTFIGGRFVAYGVAASLLPAPR